MALADNYKALELFDKAEGHFMLAANMCPGKFMPLYELVKLYEADGRTNEALTLVREIIDKDVKVPSAAVTAIKYEMRQLIERTEIDPMTGRTSDELPKNETRQGETPG